MKKRVFSAFLCVLLLLSTFSFFCTFAAGGDGLIIHQVYGLAGKDAAPVSSSFLEIYNTSNQPVSLAGVSVQYRKTAGGPFTVCALDGAKTVAAGNFGADEGFYLVLFDDGLDKDMAKLLLSHFDEQHEELVIDNKAFQLALVNGTEPIAGLSDAAVLDAVDLLSGPLAGTISKQKALRRVSPEKAAEFEVVHYGDADAEQATAWAPRCAAGKLNVCEPPQEEATLTFSKEAGLYDEPFDLTVSASNGAAVYYTLDGSDPAKARQECCIKGRLPF